MAPKNYVGIACTGHENALAIVNADGEVVFAEGIERYTQNKRALNTPADDPLRTPKLIEAYCDPGAELVVARSWSALSHQKMKTDAALMLKAVSGTDLNAHAAWIKRVMFHVGLWDTFVGPNYQLAGMGLARYADARYRKVTRRDFNHHTTHAAYACLTSPFDDAVCAVFDGYGEGTSHSYFRYEGGKLSMLDYPRSPKNLYGSLSSLGMYYGYTVCALFGLEVTNGEEWKVMGLAPYGRLDPELLELLHRHVYVDGLDLVMDQNARDSYLQLQRYTKRADQSFEDVADVAYTTQHHYNEILREIFERLYDLGISRNIVLGGGCALNSTFNGLIPECTRFKNVYIPPAPSDDGNAIGAALLAYYQDHPERQPRKTFHTPYLGSDIDRAELRQFVANGALLGRVDLAPGELCRYVAAELANGKIVAWMQGRAEFGPRALGNRSILADPRDESMKDRINAAVKFRERFRPFAPAILDEHGDEYFENYLVTPYMERTLRFREKYRARLPAVSHVDGTGRLQTVKREWNERFYDLIEAFYELTGVPVLLNTSLNVMGKPIVHSVGDAFNIYLSSGIDLLVIDDQVFSKARRAEPRAPARTATEDVHA